MKKISSPFSVCLLKGAFVATCALLIHSAGYGQIKSPNGTAGIGTTTNSATGNVGIGPNMTNPLQRLHVEGNIYIPIDNSIGVNQSDKFTFNGKDVGNYSLGWYTIAGGAVSYLSGHSGLKFFSQGTERMSITQSGNLGVGTATPGRRFQVQDGSNMKTALGINDVGEPTLILSRWGGSGATYQTAVLSTEWNGVGYGLAIGMTGWHQDNVLSSTATKMYIAQDGNVGVGTTDTKGYKLGVNGSVIATSMTVKLYANWPDFVFAKTYGLRPLSEVESFIKENSHLPEVPSAAQVAKEGINLGEMDATLLKKIEELTLYMIEQNKKIEAQSKKIETLEKQLTQSKK